MIREAFDLPQQDVKSYSPLTLAFLGDNVYDLVVRTVLLQQANRAVNTLNKKKSAVACAEFQAKMADRIMPLLSEEEISVYRRGRNAKSYTTPKHAKIGDYRKATGLEALMGYLYLQGNFERALQLMEIGLSGQEQSGQSLEE
ncbi:MAG: ribonuclease III [Lachnospiraceae bacterium]|nr:ribonuclease III [Lachnospiraceae bacterium]